MNEYALILDFVCNREKDEVTWLTNGFTQLCH